MACFCSNQLFPATKQTKGVNKENAQCTELFCLNHGNKHNPSMTSYDTEPVHTTAKPQTNRDWQCLCSDKNIGNAIEIEVIH